MGGTDNTGIDELGPVDYLVVEFPPGAQNFNGEMAAELVRLSDAGTIRVLDLLILQKAADGTIDAYEIDETDAVDEIRALETVRVRSHRFVPRWPVPAAALSGGRAGRLVCRLGRLVGLRGGRDVGRHRGRPRPLSPPRRRCERPGRR